MAGFSVTELEFRLERSPLAVTVRVNGDIIHFDGLPDGLKSIISWVADLSLRLEAIPWQEERDVFSQPIILLLEEENGNNFIETPSLSLMIITIYFFWMICSNELVMLNSKRFLLAISFYTRLPTPQNLDYQQLPQASIYLPVIGWLVGGVCALIFYLSALLWSTMTAAILALIAGILMTGAFHEDGFADVCDGFGGGWGKQRILEIMKDSQLGAYGAIGVYLLLLLKISLLSAMPVAAVPLILLAGHSISRLPPLLLMQRYSYARQEYSKGGAAVFKPGKQDLFFATACAVLPFLLLPTLCLFAIIPVLLINWLLGRYFYYYIGGYTGDCLGTIQQVAETVFYLSISTLWTFISP